MKPEVTPGEPLRLEILSFLDSVRTRRSREVTARQGRAALELAFDDSGDDGGACGAGGAGRFL